MVEPPANYFTCKYCGFKALRFVDGEKRWETVKIEE